MQRSRTPLGPALAALVASFALACQNPHPTAPAARDGGATAQRANADGGHDPCDDLRAEDRNLPVARVGDATLTVCDFARRINSQNQYLRSRFSAPEQRRALVRAWVDSELLAAEARTRGLDREPNVRHAVDAQLARQLETDVRATVQPPVITDADVEQYFNAHHAEYDTPEQVRAAQIVLPDREHAEQVLADARAHANDDTFWRDLVRRATIDPATREIGGDLGFFAAQGGNNVSPQVAQAAFALHTPGEVAPQIVESPHSGANHGPGFHIVRLIARREAMHRTLDEVRRPIRNRIWRERFDAAQQAAVRALVERLRNQSHVTVDDAALAQIHLEAAPGVPAAMPGLLPGVSPVAPVPPFGAPLPAAPAAPPGAR